MRKNKKFVEKKKHEALRKHLAQIKARRRSQLTLDRPKPDLQEKPTILIYCEGKNTEPSYFNNFRIPTITIRSFGEGRNTVSLVNRAKQISERNKYDQVWCVFDADPKSENPKQLQNFNLAIKLAKKYNFGVAYSNQAFEYWLILHFEDHQGAAMERDGYGDKLNSYLNHYGLKYDFDGDKIIDQDFFNLLGEIVRVDRNGKSISRTDNAILRAGKIYNRLDHRNPGREESSTTVHHLVKKLLKYNK